MNSANGRFTGFQLGKRNKNGQNFDYCRLDMHEFILHWYWRIQSWKTISKRGISGSLSLEHGGTSYFILLPGRGGIRTIRLGLQASEELSQENTVDAVTLSSRFLMNWWKRNPYVFLKRIFEREGVQKVFCSRCSFQNDRFKEEK